MEGVIDHKHLLGSYSSVLSTFGKDQLLICANLPALGKIAPVGKGRGQTGQCTSARAVLAIQ